MDEVAALLFLTLRDCFLGGGGAPGFVDLCPVVVRSGLVFPGRGQEGDALMVAAAKIDDDIIERLRAGVERAGLG